MNSFCAYVYFNGVFIFISFMECFPRISHMLLIATVNRITQICHHLWRHARCVFRWYLVHYSNNVPSNLNFKKQTSKAFPLIFFPECAEKMEIWKSCWNTPKFYEMIIPKFLDLDTSLRCKDKDKTRLLSIYVVQKCVWVYLMEWISSLKKYGNIEQVSEMFF